MTLRPNSGQAHHPHGHGHPPRTQRGHRRLDSAHRRLIPKTCKHRPVRTPCPCGRPPRSRQIHLPAMLTHASALKGRPSPVAADVKKTCRDNTHATALMHARCPSPAQWWYYNRAHVDLHDVFVERQQRVAGKRTAQVGMWSPGCDRGEAHPGKTMALRLVGHAGLTETGRIRYFIGPVDGHLSGRSATPVPWSGSARPAWMQT